jgi:hypothetical protein
MVKQRRKNATKLPRKAISRRKFLEGVLVASTVTGVGLRTKAAAPPLSAGSPVGTAELTASTAEWKVLSSEQSALLTSVLNRLIPATETMPGAGDVGVGRFIDDVLVDAPHLRRPILDVLQALQTDAAAGATSGGQMDARLSAIEREHREKFDVLLQATYTGYYSHPQVLKAIGWVESDKPADWFDTSLLDGVRERGPIYKNV